MVEVKSHGTVLGAHLDHRAGVAALAVGRGEGGDVADGVLLVGVAQRVEHLARHPLLHFGVARAKGLASGQLKTGARALFHAQQALL